MKGTNNSKKSKKHADDLEEELGDWETDSDDDDEEEDDEEVVIEEIKKKESSKTGIKPKPSSTSNGINSGKDDKTNEKMNNKNSSHTEATVSPKIRTEVGSQVRTNDKPASTSINGAVEHSKTTDKKSVNFSSSTDKKNGSVDVVSNDTKNEKKINAKLIPANNKIDKTDKTENLNASGKENENENGNGNDKQPEILPSNNLSVGDRVLVNSR